MAGNGPYQNERAARAVIPPEPGWSILSQAQMNELLHRALAEAGVETSEFENRTAWWLCGWEDYTIAIIVGWIARAFETGKAAGADGAVTEWAVGYTHYPDVPGAGSPPRYPGVLLRRTGCARSCRRDPASGTGGQAGAYEPRGRPVDPCTGRGGGSVITGAELVVIGIAIGWVLRSLPARRKGPKPIEAVCGCAHHHSMHDPESGACNAAVRVSHYGGSYTHEPCGCLRYSGPLPLPEYYAPEIAGEAGQ